MYYLILFEIVCISLLLILYLRDQKIIHKLNTEISGLTDHNKKLESKLKQTIVSDGVDRRDAHRVPVPKIECTIKFLNFGNAQLEKLRNKEFQGHLKDISLSGLKFICDFELPVKQNIQTEIRFQVKEESFTLKGQIMRREDHLKGHSIAYGVHFIDLSAKDVKRLNYVINKIESDKRIKIT